MKKLALCAILALLTTGSPAYALDGYISYKVFLYMHGGPGKKYRIVGRVNAGDTVKILENTAGAKYARIRTKTGREGWIPVEFLEKGQSLQVKLPKLEAQLTEEKQTLANERGRYATLNQDYQQLVLNQSSAAEEIDQLKSKIHTLEQELEARDESNLLRWFTHGGLVALGGVILGLMLPLFGRKKRDTTTW